MEMPGLPIINSASFFLHEIDQFTSGQLNINRIFV